MSFALRQGLIALACLGAWGAASAQDVPPGAVVEGQGVKGLEAPGQIVIDHWGIPHIYAASVRDAFFLQGWNAARDRLWQIDLWRKRGLGRLSASFGPAFVEQDRAARLFLYRGDMAKEWAAYPPAMQASTAAFTAGINAYVQAVKAGTRPMPPEFALTGSRPELWAPEDVVRIRSHTLVSNLTGEIARAQSLCAGGQGAEPLRRNIEPPHALDPPKDVDPCWITPEILKTYLLATSPVRFDGKKVVAEVIDLKRLAEADAVMSEQGSNNWVVAPGRTTTGRPILANDPHREHAVPSLRYLVHLDAPGLHLIGAGEPALPGVTFGHNDDAAWGITIFPADQQDLYVYRLSPDHPDAYAYKGGFEPMTVVHETLPVKGEADRTVTLEFTRHGPVLALDAAKGRAFAVRSVWSEPGGAGYFNASWLFNAKTWADFETAHARWGAPPLNLVYADRSGDIGWLPSAFVPRRPNWDGLTPEPGDGRYEWAGFLEPGLLPGVRNPEQGWWATANEMNLPKDYPNERYKISFEWTDRSRIDRIQTVLRNLPKVSLVDCERLQTDVHSPLALRATALLKDLQPDDADQAAALALLRGWDGEEGVNSAPAALYEIWATRHLRAEAVARLVPKSAQAAFSDPQLAAVVSTLATRPDLLGPDPAGARSMILKVSLADAYREAVMRMGPDPKAWRWGSIHRAAFAPAAAALADPSLRAQLSVGPLEVGGSASTPMATTYEAKDFFVRAGASVRMVLDVGAWDNSVVVNTPGQSGDPFSPHYRDLFPLWAAGGYAPLLYSKAAVFNAAERVINVTPD
jgi:penicillin amidase